MESYRKFEQGVGQDGPRPDPFPPVKKKLGVALGLGGAVLGVVMITSGLGLLTTVTADVNPAGLPPVPPGPADQAPSTTCAEPKVSPNGSVELDICSGWNMVSGSILEGFSLNPLLEKNLVLYSYNDPAYPVSGWATIPVGGVSSGQSALATSLVSPRAPLGYYLYNGAGEVKITLSPQSTGKVKSKEYAYGWHLLFWPGEVASREEFLNALNLTYDKKGIVNGIEAVNPKNHLLSPRIFVVVNERSAASGMTKELGNSDDDATISKIPTKSYFWIYLHRSDNRAVDLKITATSSR